MSITGDILKAARAEVAKGWCKGSLEDSEGNVCALGALNRAATGDALVGDWRKERRIAPWRAVRDCVPGEVPIINYNNAETTTQQDILNLFDKALVELGEL